MNRSTTLYIAVATLILGSGTSFFAFVQPALDQQGKLKTQKTGLEATKTGLEVQVKDLESKAQSSAMKDIAFFDLRVSQNKRREMETKTVQTLASLTEIFNDHKIRVQSMMPTGETEGLNKPVPSPAAGASPAPGAVAAAPTPTPVPSGVPTSPPPIQLTHKAFKLQVRGEYADLVKALSEIQGLPKAISVNQYDLKLLDPGEGASPPPAADNGKLARAESPTALEMSFQVSITFLMAGGTPPTPAPNQPPIGALPMAMPTAVVSAAGPAAIAEWLLGGPAFAAEPARAGRRYRLDGLRFEGGALHVVTTGGTPPYTLVGVTDHRAVLELRQTTLGAGAEAATALAGAFRDVHVAPAGPDTVRITIDTDGSKRLNAHLDKFERLAVTGVSWKAPVASAPMAVPAAKAHAPAARPHAAALGLTRFEGVSLRDGELVVATSGAAPRFVMLGGTKKRLVVELTNTAFPARGKAYPIHAGGMIAARAVLYANRPMTTHLTIDTDGSVKLAPYVASDGLVHVRVAGTAPKPAAKAPAHVAAAPKAPAPHAEAHAPHPAPRATPMAVPHQSLAAKKVQPTPGPAFKEAPVPEDEPHLQRSLSSSYRFPIERERTTGRANPFKVLPSRVKPRLTETPPAIRLTPLPLARVPALPAPQAIGAPPAMPGMPASAAALKSYTLVAVVTGGGQPPIAVVKVDGKSHVVGLGEELPGNARVKSILADAVVVTANDQDLRLVLKK